AGERLPVDVDAAHVQAAAVASLPEHIEDLAGRAAAEARHVELLRCRAEGGEDLRRNEAPAIADGTHGGEVEHAAVDQRADAAGACRGVGIDHLDGLIVAGIPAGFGVKTLAGPG